MKKALPVLLALILLLCLSCPVFCEDQTGSKVRFEGDGFDTPEEAVLAYIEAWNRGDVHGALSTFAIESLVDHTDTEYYLEYFRTYNPAQNYLFIPAGNTWIRDLEVTKRYAEVSTYLYNQYMTNNSGDYAQQNGQPVRIRTQEEIDSLLALYETPLTESWTGNIRFLEWIDPVQIDKLASYSSLRAITLQADLYGADDIMPLIAHISLGRSGGILTMECLSYGGRWFNFRTYGNAAMTLRLDPYSGGLFVFPAEEALQLMQMYLTEPDPEAEAVLKSHLASSLPGTRWKLVKASGSEKFTVVSQIDDLNGRDPEGTGIWAELHFTSLGSSIHTAAADPAAAETVKRDRLYCMWVEEGNFIRFDGDLTGKGVTSGNQLVITLEDGMIVQLEKIDDCSVCRLH